jgi:glycosyltransferase involved in cell wall biosynthesis
MERSWSINGRFLAHPVTGVQRYAREIVRALDQLVSERHPLAAHANIELLVPPGAPQIPGLRAISQTHIGSLGGHLWEQTVLPAHVKGGLLSLCNVGPLAISKQIVCIHDLNTRAYPQSYSLAFRALYRTLIPALGARARAIATVSDYSASQLTAHRIARRSEILVIPNGHEHTLSWQTNRPHATPAACNDTIVLLGSPAPHKNARIVLSLAPQLAELGLKIAVVGASDARVFGESGTVARAPNIDWLGRIADEQLAELLQQAFCLAFPSYAEGFGLPPLEAMAVGCPVVVSDRCSLPEVCGEAALYANADDSGSWLDAFRRLQAETGLRERMILAGRSRARRFNWRHSAALYLKAMAGIDGFVPQAGNSTSDIMLGAVG